MKKLINYIGKVIIFMIIFLLFVIGLYFTGIVIYSFAEWTIPSSLPFSWAAFRFIISFLFIVSLFLGFESD